MACISLREHDDIAWIEIDHPAVDVPLQDVMQALFAALENALNAPHIQAMVISHRVALGDASFISDENAPSLSELSNRVEASPKPIVALWHDKISSPSLQLGLASHMRVITAHGSLAFSDIKRGLLPNAGGTQRLPRLVGTQTALDLIVAGRTINAQQALECGLVDAIAQDDARALAIAMARSCIGHVLRRTRDRIVPDVDSLKIDAHMSAMLQRYRGQDAPQEAARLIRMAHQTPFDEGLQEEQAAFWRLRKGPQYAALCYATAAERDLATRQAKIPGIARPVYQIGVIGAGTMGAGISVALLNAGLHVVLVETTEDALQRGRARIESIFDRLVAQGRMNEQTRHAHLARLQGTCAMQALKNVDLIIEAVFEDMAVKMALLEKLDAIIRDECILATNTSYLNVNQMASSLRNPSRLIGMHFFSPAHVMRLLEIIRAEKSAPDAVATALSVAKRLNKIAIIAGVCDGFIGNRIFSRYRRECEFMLEEGALPHDIDNALEEYGFAMGPFATSDLAGLDISWARRKALSQTRRADERYVPLADRICEMGRFGQKTGSGWYRYDHGKRLIDPIINALVRDHALSTQRPQISFTPSMIVSRVLDAMADEGDHILRENIAECAQDIDLVMLNGYGFPAFRGGPLYAAAERIKPQPKR